MNKIIKALLEVSNELKLSRKNKVALYVKDLSQLKKFLSLSEVEKVEDLLYRGWEEDWAEWLIYYKPKTCRKLIKNYPGFEKDAEEWEWDITSEDDWESIIKHYAESADYSDDSPLHPSKLGEDNCERFIEHWSSSHSWTTETPSWFFFESWNIYPYRNNWLVHFTRNAEAIAQEGFTKGALEMSEVGYTGGGAKQYSEGYNFAYRPNDIGPSAEYWDAYEKMGQCVVFRASGLNMYHKTDEEWQTVFYGPTATDIVPVYKVGSDWCVGRKDSPVYKNSDIKKAVSWVISNYAQYRKTLTNPNSLNTLKWKKNWPKREQELKEDYEENNMQS